METKQTIHTDELEPVLVEALNAGLNEDECINLAIAAQSFMKGLVDGQTDENPMERFASKVLAARIRMAVKLGEI